MSGDPLDQLRAVLGDVARQLAGEEAASRPLTFERPPQAELGDYSTNAALVLASLAKQPPRELGQRLGETLQRRLPALQRFEVAGPGFLNLFLDDDWHRSSLAAVLAAGQRFGGGGAQRERILVEFVSANPTGPMHVGHARNAAYGDSLCRMLAFHGHQVEREFYVNDAGSQVRKLGESIAALARGQQVPQDGYKGEYVQELADRIAGADTLDPQRLGVLAVGELLSRIEESLRRFNVLDYDHWQYESALHEPDERLCGPDGRAVSPVEHALQLLAEAGHTYEHDGALWLRTTAFGDDKDRVLIRSTGEHTYFASDIAYHQAKRERGYQRQIDVWGADHHGYLLRMRAAYEALGGDPRELELLTMQLVHLLSAGERSQMSKRAGAFVTLDDLVAEIGVDAARWYLLSRSHDTTVDLDIELASSQSSENPVYYVQYAHARISSVIRRAGHPGPAGWGGDAAGARAADARVADAGTADAGTADGSELDLHPSERAVIKALLDFPSEVAEAASRRAPHRIASYSLSLAQEFTAFYRDCRVLGAEPQAAETLRLQICAAVQGVLRRSLTLLGVSAPEQM